MRNRRKPSGHNLVKNGDFRDDLKHWEGMDLELETIDGRRALRGRPNQLTYASQGTGQNVALGKAYRLQFMTVAKNSSPNQKIIIQLGAMVNGTEKYRGLSTIRYDNQAWTTFTSTFAPEVSGTLQAEIRLINESTAVCVYVADVQIVEMPDSPIRHMHCLAVRCKRLAKRIGRLLNKIADRPSRRHERICRLHSCATTPHPLLSF